MKRAAPRRNAIEPRRIQLTHLPRDLGVSRLETTTKNSTFLPRIKGPGGWRAETTRRRQRRAGPMEHAHDPRVDGLDLPKSDSQRAPKPSGTKVRFCAVVRREDGVVAAIAIDGTAKFSDIRRCFHPARSLRIELSKFLQFSILFFR